MVTTLDHISDGRAMLGIGGAWFETEHAGLGVEFGGSPGERLRWLEEAVQIMRGMLDGTKPSGSRYYHAADALNEPRPIQDHLPILIGGGGERKTLRIVAQCADACNLGGGFESVKRKDEILRRHCDEVGRDESEIERTVGAGTLHHPRRSRGGEARCRCGLCAQRRCRAVARTSRSARPRRSLERLRPFLGIGFRHFIFGFPSPYDAETMERLMTEVKPMLAGA